MKDPQVGDKVRFTKEAARSNFGDAKADRRKRFTITHVKPHYGFSTPDVVLSDGEVWNSCWLEPVEGRS